MVHLDDLSSYVHPNLRSVWESRCRKLTSFVQTFKKGYMEQLAKRRTWNTDNSTTLRPGSVCLLDSNNSFERKKLWPLVRVRRLIKSKRDGKIRQCEIQLSDGDYLTTNQDGKTKYTVIKKPSTRVVSVQQLRKLDSWDVAAGTCHIEPLQGSEDHIESHKAVVITNIATHQTAAYDSRAIT